jgi:hypothetical protein
MAPPHLLKECEMKGVVWVGVIASVMALSAAGAASGSTRDRLSACPVPQSGTCRGVLGAGTYTSQSFQPRLRFTVPKRWANYLDVSGLYLLQPPGSKPPGNSIAGSFIGLETSVAPEASDCQSPVSGVKRSPAAIVKWMKSRRSLVVRDVRPAHLGGLSGLVFEVRMRRGTKGCLAVGASTRAAPLLVGVGASSFDHEVTPTAAERHYLLRYRHGTLDVALVDTSGGRELASFNRIASTFRFNR